VLALDLSVIEGFERTRKGLRKKERQSTKLVTDFLRERRSFSEAFHSDQHDDAHRGTCPCIACDFYRNVRSGLLHEGETQNGWLLRYGAAKLVTTRSDNTRVLDRNRFHAGVEAEFQTYIRDLTRDAADSVELRANLKRVLDGVCGGDQRAEKPGARDVASRTC
jgi:hypothetical protein